MGIQSPMGSGSSSIQSLTCALALLVSSPEFTSLAHKRTFFCQGEPDSIIPLSDEKEWATAVMGALWLFMTVV